MQKIKLPALKGMQIHHQREKESRTNFDIDESRMLLNYDLVNDEPIDFNKRVHEIIAAQKTGTRKIRKDAVLVNELLVTSDALFFEPLSPAEQRRFFEESMKLFQARYGEQSIAYALVHVDEKTPHMHLDVVPMCEGRLQGKISSIGKSYCGYKKNFRSTCNSWALRWSVAKKALTVNTLRCKNLKK